MPIRRHPNSTGFGTSPYSGVLAFQLQTLVEQGVALLGRLAEAAGATIAPAVLAVPDHLRFGVPTTAARGLAAAGVRHRRAAVALGAASELRDVQVDTPLVVAFARPLLDDDPERWRQVLGDLVFNNTLEDLGAPIDGA